MNLRPLFLAAVVAASSIQASAQYQDEAQYRQNEALRRQAAALERMERGAEEARAARIRADGREAFLRRQEEKAQAEATARADAEQARAQEEQARPVYIPYERNPVQEAANMRRLGEEVIDRQEREAHAREAQQTREAEAKRQADPQIQLKEAVKKSSYALYAVYPELNDKTNPMRMAFDDFVKAYRADPKEDQTVFQKGDWPIVMWRKFQGL